MNITVEKESSPIAVTIVTPHGDLDASNYLELVAKVQELYQSGSRDLLLDLGDTPFVSSAGMVALHSISLLLNGKEPLDPESGWAAIHSLDQAGTYGIQQHIKLLNPQPRVERTLDRTGFKEFLQIYTDRQAALDSFKLQDAESPTV